MAAQRHGVAPNQPYYGRRLIRGALMVRSYKRVAASSEVCKLENRFCDPQRPLGRKTIDNEILPEALSKTRKNLP